MSEVPVGPEAPEGTRPGHTKGPAGSLVADPALSGWVQAFTRSGLSADLWPEAAAQARVARFLTLRAQWAQVHNLSGPAALRGEDFADLIDAVALTAVLVPGLTLVDVGSGSGVPGLLVACLRPELSVRLVEPLAKRTAFLRSAAQQLGLQRVAVHRDRWPLSAGERRLVPAPERWQVVSRAVVSPESWPGLAAAGGPEVRAVLRLLAAQRPDAGLADFAPAAAVDYAVGDHARRVERLDRD